MNPRIRTYVFSISALLLLVGAVLYLTRWVVAPYLFAVGSAGITVCYLTESVVGLDFRQKRLHRFNVLSGLLMIAASAFMFKGKMEWVVLLAISAIFQTYAAFMSGKGKSPEQGTCNYLFQFSLLLLSILVRILFDFRLFYSLCPFSGCKTESLK